MKLLGHAWVAVKSYPEGKKQLLILGSILPEITFYTKKHVFSLEEIHEGGDVVYKYLKDNKPDWTDLGLGMLAHSGKMGADRFNMDDKLALLGYKGKKKKELRYRISDILNISYQTAKIRAHSIYELAVELRIINNHPGFVDDFNKAIADKEKRKKIALILADCFGKDRAKVDTSVNELLNKAKPSCFNNSKGLAHLWADLSKEFDPEPDKERLAGLLEELHESFNGKDRIFLDECIKWTGENLKTFVSEN